MTHVQPRGLVRRIARKSIRTVKECICKEILVLGDSHVEVFDAFNNHLAMNRIDRWFFRIVAVGGATVSGLENPNSKTQAYVAFDAALRTSTAAKAIVMLGEIDAGFVIWYRAERYGESVAEMARLAERTYEKFIRKVGEKCEPIVISCPLPTIEDGTVWGEVANARREVTATQLERTRLTIQFNRAIEEICAKSDIKYLNLDEESLASNGLVRKELLNDDWRDHHYNQTVYARLLEKGLVHVL